MTKDNYLIYLILLALILFTKCTNENWGTNKKNNIHKPEVYEYPYAYNNNSDSITLIEYWVDSLNIGVKKQNKLEGKIFRTKDSNYIQLIFYSRASNKWEIRNKYNFKKDLLSGSYPKVSDFNNDSFNDFNYKAQVAIRGANDIRRLFIYSPTGDSLILIKNSLDYPNMICNNELKCIDAVLVHGCSSQAFLKIKKDSLIDFAWINLTNGIYIYEIDSLGKKTKILSDSITNYGCCTRFINYSPLIPYPYNTF